MIFSIIFVTPVYAGEFFNERSAESQTILQELNQQNISLEERLNQCIGLNTDQTAGLEQLEAENNELSQKNIELEEKSKAFEEMVQKDNETFNELINENEELASILDKKTAKARTIIWQLFLSLIGLWLIKLFRNKSLHYQKLNNWKTAKFFGITAIIILGGLIFLIVLILYHLFTLAYG